MVTFACHFDVDLAACTVQKFESTSRNSHDLPISTISTGLLFKTILCTERNGGARGTTHTGTEVHWKLQVKRHLCIILAQQVYLEVL